MRKYRYWLVSGGEAQHELDQMIEEAKDASVKCKVFIKKVGGNNLAKSPVLVQSTTGRLVGVAFKEKPDGWTACRRAPSGYYSPKRNSKAGRELHAEMSAIRWAAGEDLGTRLLGHGSILIPRDGSMFIASPHTQKIDGKTVLVAADDEKSGTKWKPVGGLRELKASEYYKMVEEAEEAGTQ